MLGNESRLIKLKNKQKNKFSQLNDDKTPASLLPASLGEDLKLFGTKEAITEDTVATPKKIMAPAIISET